MDIQGGTLNYEGMSVLNDVESAASFGQHAQKWGRFIPTPACLQQATETLERDGEHLCPFQMIQTDFGCSNHMSRYQCFWVRSGRERKPK